MFTLAAPFEHEEEIKRSRFLARASSVDSAEEALAFLERIKDPEATHNCWAYRIGDAYRFSDDGEPGGTAGRPILAAIDGQHVDHVVVVVTRWFGGTKLGAGGLVRAYGGVASECLRRAPRKEVLPCVRLHVEVAFEDIGAVYPVIERMSARKIAEQYGDTGLALDLELDARCEVLLRDALRDATRGRVKFA
ncbi:MAG: YigZ family protein [Deltaproteobacteria bacterium]|nr:YigZ family protein [Deltaproteobacteria bacterium]